VDRIRVLKDEEVDIPRYDINNIQTMITLYDWDNLLEINRQGWHNQQLLCAKDVKPQRPERLLTIVVEQNVQILISVDDRDQLG